MTRWIPLSLVVIAGLLLLKALHAGWPDVEREPGGDLQPTVRGRVVDVTGPVAGARVGIKGRRQRVKTDAEGHFTLPVDAPPPLRIVASKEGYYIAGINWPGKGPVTLELRVHPSEDSPEYEWIAAEPNPAGEEQCGNCHRQIFDEWSHSPHATSATNRRFLNLYEGTDWEGNRNVGWNLLAEFPEGSGVCYSCHAPSLEPDPVLISDLRNTRGVARQGVHCDFCHKIAEVSIDRVGYDHGRFAMKLIRPQVHQQLFFGPLDDEDRGNSVHSPLYRQSRYCASCHEGVLFGTHAYSEYSEWLASPYAKRGVECQDCHMKASGRMRNFAPGRGGIPRDPQTLAGHRGSRGDPAALRSCLSLSIEGNPVAEGLEIMAEVKVEGVGHRMPTGYPSRQLILWVHATDGQGRPLELLDGPRLPPLAGRGAVGEDGLAGQPGRMYAKLLEGLDGRQPVPYWTACRVQSDTRLMPDETDRARFVFRRFDRNEKVRVVGRLIYRRFSKQLADQKGWPDNEILVAQKRWPPQ